MQKFKIVDVVNRRFSNPRNIISALTEKLSQQFGFNEGAPFGTDVPGDFDPADRDGTGLQYAVPPESIIPDDDWTPDSVEPGWTLEEELTVVGGAYFTSFPVEFFRNVWFDGLLATPTQHYTLSGSFQLIPNANLLSGTEIIGQYVVGYE